MLEGMILKPNMVLSGNDVRRAGDRRGGRRGDARAASAATCRPAVPGIVFLSGGQSDEEATAHLNAMNALGPHPVAAVASPTAARCRRRAQGLGRQDGERRGGAEGVLPAREAERRGAVGLVHARDGAGSRVAREPLAALEELDRDDWSAATRRRVTAPRPRPRSTLPALRLRRPLASASTTPARAHLVADTAPLRVEPSRRDTRRTSRPCR